VDGNELLPALDNHSMGTIFEELIRRFNEENNEEAGEHFTPRDVVRLIADLIFLPVADDIESGTYLVYDAACGTGGMLTVAEERLAELAESHGKDVSIHLFGQEVQPETYAISKADLLLKGEGAEAENMKYGSTLSSDAFPSQEFDFMLSNPPYGKSWKTDLERLVGKGDIKDPRFVTQHGGDPEYKMITRSSDGQLMFLVNKLSKMKHSTRLGSRIAEVHNGSSLFTGDAGQGESNIRRWIIENDWLEAIIALPENSFYNTGILTALGKFIGSGFQTFAMGLRAGTWGIGGIITWISLMFLMGGIIVTASHRLFGLITWIPDNVMKWIGHNPHALGEQDAEGRVRAGFGGFTSALQASARPMGRGMRQPLPTGGGETPTTPGNQQRNDQLAADTGTGRSPDGV
jgi:hypothetical protein